MPDPAQDATVTLTRDGHAVIATPDQVPYLTNLGYAPETDAEREAREAQARFEARTGGLSHAIGAGTSAFFGGATLGLSDVAIRALGGEGAAAALGEARAAHPYVSTAANIAGALIPLSPAGFVNGIGSKIAEGMGGGLLGTAAEGALVGGAQNTGSYISDVALGNRDLSAEGFLGAMGKGAFYGGVSAGALSLASNGAIAARRLLPSFELTPEAVADAQTAATQAIGDSVDTSSQLEGTAQDQATSINRETQQFLADLEAERAAALQQSGDQAMAAVNSIPPDVPIKRGIPSLQGYTATGLAPDAATADEAAAAEQSVPIKRGLPGKGTNYTATGPAVEGEFGAAPAAAQATPGNAPYLPTPAEIAQNGWSAYPEAFQYLRNQAVEAGDFPTIEQPAAEGAAPEQPTETPTQPPKQPPADLPEAGTEPPNVADQTAKALLKAWRAKYPSGAVDYDAATTAARKGRLAEWAKNFVPKTSEDETIKEYFSNPQDPMRTAERLGGIDAPQAVKNAATNAAAEASHTAYHAGLAEATNVAKSGAELMARATYAARKAAAQAMDDVYTAYKAGMPIIDIQQAASKKLTDQLHELVEARADMVKSLAGKPAAAQAVAEQLSGPSLGEKILGGTPKPVNPDEVIAKALGAGKDINEDIADLAPKITRYEAAKAAITESLADKAPPDALAHAQAFQQAKEAADAATAKNTADAADSIDKLQRGVPVKNVAGGGKALLKTASNVGTGYELLRDLGVPLPDPKKVPVIGPLLSMYLKAKVWSRLLRGKGGIIAESAEGTIAAKAAQTRQRIVSAVDTMLSGTAKVTQRAAEMAGPMALAHKLFDDGQKQPYTSQPDEGSLEDNYQARLAELTKAIQPGAIEQAVKARVHTTDPTIVDAIIAAETNKAQYLYNTAPKPDGPPMPGQPQRLPSKAEIEDWSHPVAAAHDPALIFEKVAAGGRARPSEIDCLNNCYPNLIAEARTHAVEKMAKMSKPLPYTRRVAVSMLTGIPLDSTMTPDHAAFLQQGFSIPAAMPTPPMPHPTLSGNISLGQQSLTRLDK